MHSNFQGRLFRTITIIITIFWGILSVLFLAFACRSLYKDSVSNMENIAVRTGSEIENLLENMDSVAIAVSTDTDVISVFTTASSSRITNNTVSDKIMPRLLTAMIPNSVSRFRITLYNARGNFISSGLSYDQSAVNAILTDEDYGIWYQALPVHDTAGALICPETDIWSQEGERTISLYRNIYHASYINVPTGVIQIQCPVKYFRDLMQDESHLYEYALYDSDGGMICCSAGFDPAASFCLRTKQPLQNGFTLALSRPLASVLRLLAPLSFYIIVFYITALLCCLQIIRLTTRRITKPLVDLTEKVHAITLAQPQLHMDLQAYPDEFAQLTDAFTQMMDRLQLAMEESIKSRTYEMQANMIALQSQMNPHFLYNILTVIKVQAMEGNTAQVSTTCNYLAGMLRYIAAYSQESATAAQEFHHAELYLKLMKTRYEDLFTYTIRISEEFDAEHFTIPKLSIQPMLENCFQHGFKQVLPVWNIDLKAYVEEDRHVISICDNGSGFSQEAAAALQERVDEFLSHPSDSIPNLTLGGMGLINTLVRMKMLFHDRFSYEITPAGERGTVIWFCIRNE